MEKGMVKKTSMQQATGNEPSAAALSISGKTGNNPTSEPMNS
jgi:hypothetical protein